MSAQAAPSTKPDAAEALRAALAGQIGRGALKLPLLPQVVGDVLSLANDPNSDISELAGLIHRDQALAGHVLRIANSAAYCGGEPIVSLQQAVTRLGMKLLNEITIAVSMQNDVFKVKGFEDEIKTLWRHALASGAYGKEAARMKRTNVESQFLCGLLHTIGKPVGLQACVDLVAGLKLELDVAGILSIVEEYHTVVGEALAERWQLPMQVRATCAWYVNFPEAPSFQNDCALTYLSDKLATWLVRPDAVPEETLKADSVFEFLNFYPDEIESLLARKDEVRAVVDAMDL